MTKPPAEVLRVLMEMGARWFLSDVPHPDEPPIHVYAPPGKWFAVDEVTRLLCWDWQDVAHRLSSERVEERPEGAGADADEVEEMLAVAMATMAATH